jgi:nanoRNase/pAp phosphatase (c-di-AMP/oligoRNAs hydrolase)
VQKGGLQKFVDILKSKKKIIILLHNNPDPDGIGSALGLKAIISDIGNSKVTIVYGGIIGRAENQEMIRALKIKMVHIDNIDLKRHQNIILVDTQPMIGNNSLPKGVHPKIVIDHHPLKKSALKADVCDVRVKYGSTSTIVLEYIKKLGVKMDKMVATALFYGIKTDTDDIGRDRTKMDNDAMSYLYPVISPVILSKMQHPRIPMDYYIHFHEAMNNASIVKDVIISDLKNECTPDMIAEMSDFFLRMKGIRWVLCLGVYGSGLYFSIRTTSRSLRAGEIAIMIARKIGTAGGHHKSAGGYVFVSDKTAKEINDIKDDIKTKFLKSINRVSIKSKKIIEMEGGK